MTKKDGSRFDNLFSAARSRPVEETDNVAPPPEALPQSREKSSTRKSKSTDPNYVRATIYLPRSVHRKLKALAADEEREMSDIVSELIEQWLKSKEPS